MLYFGTRISDNISIREPEGYLICLNVPVARTGTQDYLPEELGVASEGKPYISVMRPEEEVFAKEAMASFEGLPVTNDHPDEGVDIENIRRLNMGHAQNIRRGTDEESDLLLADLYITDKRLIQLIQDGKREISCGYNYDLTYEDGQYVQRRIRGNHIAVVDAGRAGPRVSIKDNKPKEERSTVMKKTLSKLLARMAKDGSVEEVAEAIEEILGEAPAETVAEEVAEAVEAAAAEEVVTEPVVVEAPEDTPVVVDEASVAGIIERLDRLIELLTPAAVPTELQADEDPVEEVIEAIEQAAGAVETEEVPAEAPVSEEEEVAALVEEILDPVVSETIEEQTDENCEDPEGCSTSKDALRNALKAVRPVLKSMSADQRKKVVSEISSRMKVSKRNSEDDAYNIIRSNHRKANEVTADLGKKIMEARNPNYKK